ncbi:hypothetical protein Dimus_032641 [Dionaea muscipula]
MDCVKPPPPSESKKSRISRTLSKCIHPPQTPTRSIPNYQGQALHDADEQGSSKSQEELFSIKEAVFSHRQKKKKKQNKKQQPQAQPQSQRSHHPQHQQATMLGDRSADQAAAKETLVAELFASVSSIKAAYAELQTAQSPYCSEAVESADEAVVNELKVLSELKQRYSSSNSAGSGRSTLDLPPPHHVTQLLAEIQEQQSNIKTYEITLKQMEIKIQHKDSVICSLKKELEATRRVSKSLKERLSSSTDPDGLGRLLLGLGGVQIDQISVSDLNHSHFIRVLRSSVRSIQIFVRLLMREMEAKGWDTDLAAANAVAPAPHDHVVVKYLTRARHKAFAFESFVSRVMFDGFNNMHHTSCLELGGGDQLTSLENGNKLERQHEQAQAAAVIFFREFQELLQLSATSSTCTTGELLSRKPRSRFARFCREKYLKLIHPKMECSLFGNLNQRKLVVTSISSSSPCSGSSRGGGGAFPTSRFFGAFAEMSKLIFMLHCLARCYDTPAVAFQVKKGSRYSAVYMENVAAAGIVGGDSQVAFMVVPGFKIGQTIIQSLVYVCQSSSSPLTL